MSSFKYDVDVERTGSHISVSWSNPIVGFSTFDVCTETGFIYADGISEHMAKSIMCDWLKLASTGDAYPQRTYVETTFYDQYEDKRTIVLYSTFDEITQEFDKHHIVITSTSDTGAVILSGLFKHKMPNVYAAKRYVKDYLTSMGCCVLER